MFEIAKTENLAEYEDFIASSSKGHFMQSHLWAGVKPAWNWEGVFTRGGDGRINGALSVLIRRVPGLPLTFMYGGRGPVCDMNDREVLCALLDGARMLAKKYRSYMLKIDPDIPVSETGIAGTLTGLGFRKKAESKNFEGIQPRFVFRLPIEGKTEDDLFLAFESKTRYNIRLALRKGVEARICGKNALDDFTMLMSTTGERDHFIVRNKVYFEKLMDSLGEHARLYMAYYNGRAVAGTLAIAYGDKVWYLYGASSNEYRNVMPNYLLQWEMIKWAVSLGARIYDFRGVSGDLSEDNPLYGLFRFKKGFGGEFTEFAGEFDYLFKPLAAILLENGQRLYRTARKKVVDIKNTLKKGARHK